MNFEYMPELRSPYGYAAIWVLMLSIIIGLVIYFKKKKWM
jgi:magnesium transporter